MRRAALLCVSALTLVLAALSAGPVASAASPPAGDARAPAKSWAAQEIKAVVNAGIMGPGGAAFRPDDNLTKGELYDTLLLLGHSPVPPLDPAKPVTMRELDAKLVAALGLGATAWRIRVAVRDAGLQPTSFLGTETVARLLGLRINHPQTDEWLERGPNMPASRAEAAYSLARFLTLAPWKIDALNRSVDTLAPLMLTDWQTSVLTRGVRLVGFPYVFAGTSERPQKLWGASGLLVDAPAGFDCSGFVWRVFKTQPFFDAPQLATVLQGRTTYAMSSEVPAALRIRFDELEPGDVIFFGSKGPASKPAQIGHMGVYLGSGWFVHSSGNGVTLQPLEGWYRDTFAWARRPLAEAGLSA
jgi:cell wall-associated NlpC family hydrolase